MNRDHNVHRPTRAAKETDSKAIVTMVAAGRPNPFPAGSPEHIAYSWTSELLRHAESESTSDLARNARRIFPNARRRTAERRVAGTEGVETASATPPVPDAKPKVPYQERWRSDQLLPVSDDFAQKIDEAETSEGQWDKVSPIGAVGRYQLTHASLNDVGLMDKQGNWYGTDLEEFRANPPLQNLALAAYLHKNRGYLMTKHDVQGEGGETIRESSFNFIGQEIEGKAKTFNVTESGLLAAAHRWGAENVFAYLQHQKVHDWVTDEEGFGVNKDKFLAIETRLREFEFIPLYRQPDAMLLNKPDLSE